MPRPLTSGLLQKPLPNIPTNVIETVPFTSQLPHKTQSNIPVNFQIQRKPLPSIPSNSPEMMSTERAKFSRSTAADLKLSFIEDEVFQFFFKLKSKFNSVNT